MSSIGLTFLAALRSVGTAATMAAVGFYMDHRGFIQPGSKKTFALLSKHVTIPAYLFTKIVYCEQDGGLSGTPCPSMTDNLSDVWMLLFWPLVVVGVGLLVGWVVAVVSSTPVHQRGAVLASCAFGNSTGLPITLLTVIQANFPKTTELGRIDATLYLSVYLILYPLLQWGVGGWLLAPAEDATGDDDGGTSDSRRSSILRQSSLQHVLNVEISERMLASEESQRKLQVEQDSEEETILSESPKMPRIESGKEELVVGEITPLITESKSEDDIIPFTETLSMVASKVLQPPVIGALAGMLVSSIHPLRQVFVDMYDRNDDSPLEWFFDGLYAVGQAAVPINMAILGINLSRASVSKSTSTNMMSSRTMAATVVGKMVIMPIIGILLAIALKNYFWHVPDDIDGAFYLVLMIVFITPTANNIMVMVELSGSGSQEGMARLVAWQYAVAPILLSISVAFAVSVAARW